MIPVILITMSIVIVLSLIILFPSLESKSDFNYDYKMAEYQLNVSRGVSKKKMEIQRIENHINHLNNIISTTKKHIEILEKLYPDGYKYITPILRPDHFNKVELCGDKEVDDKYSEVLSKQNELEDIMLLHNHIIKSYNKYRDNRNGR